MKSSGGGAADFPGERVEAALASIREVLGELCRERDGPPPALVGPEAGADMDDVLTNLYVAGLHLHSSLKVDDVLVNLREILINFVGVERFRIYFVDRAAGFTTGLYAERSACVECGEIRDYCRADGGGLP